MRERKMTFRREELERLSSAELNRLVRSELAKDSIDRDAVLQILRILEARDAKDPTLQKVDDTAAWEEFQTHFVVTEDSRSMSDNTHTQRKAIPWFAKTAVAAIIIFALLFAAPPALGHENIFKLIGSWTQEIFQLFDPSGDSMPQTEREFKTEHPGLQQVYDAVEDLGITQPAVPTWIPENYVLRELKITSMPTGTRVHASLGGDDCVAILTYDTYREGSESKYEKNEDAASVYEIANTVFYIVSNKEKWVAIWEVEGFECSLLISEERDTLLKILESIYMEVNQ